MNKLYHIFSVLYGEVNYSINLTLDEVVDYIVNNIELEDIFNSIIDNNEELQQMDEDLLFSISNKDIIKYTSDEVIECCSETILKDEYNYDITDSQIFYSESGGKLKRISPEEIVSQKEFCELFRKKWEEIYAE